MYEKTVNLPVKPTEVFPHWLLSSFVFFAATNLDCYGPIQIGSSSSPFDRLKSKCLLLSVLNVNTGGRILFSHNIQLALRIRIEGVFLMKRFFYQQSLAVICLLSIFVLLSSCSVCFHVFWKVLPQSIKYFPIVPDPEQLIGRRYPVRIGVLGISKDGVGQPDQTDHIAGWKRGKLIQRERGKEVRLIPSDFFEMHEAALIPNKSIIKYSSN